ncbi:MAG: hypothetical protein ACP8RL_05425 [cyanobacterium endosymbiont of Rhopalodia inflata]
MKTTFFKDIPSNVIENYIQRVTELSQSSQRIPTMGEVAKIAAELGIEPDEIENDQCYQANVSKLHSHMNQLKRQSVGTPAHKFNWTINHAKKFETSKKKCSGG